MDRTEEISGTKINWFNLPNKYKSFLTTIGLCILGLVIGLKPIPFGILLSSLIVFVLFFSYLEIGLLLFIMFMPLHVILVKQMGLLPGMWKELLLAFVLVLWIGKGIIKKIVVLTRAEINIPLLLFIAYCSALLLNNINEFNANIMGLRNLVQYSLVYFLVINILRGKDSIKKYVFLLLTIGMLIALTNTVQFLSQPGVIDRILREPYHSSTKFLAYGFLGENNYPFYLDALICISIGLFLFADSKKIKFLLLCNICILVISLFLTYSRGGILALIVAILFWGIKYNKKVSISLLLLCLAGVFLVPSTMHERFLTSGSFKEAITSRIDILSESLSFAVKNPLFGIGLGKVGTAGPDTLFPHNYLMYLLLQTGILGLSIYLWMFAIFFKTSLKLYEKLDRGFLKGLTAGIIMYYVMFAVSFLASASGEAFLSAFLFWFLGGVVMILDNDIRYSKTQDQLYVNQ